MSTSETGWSDAALTNMLGNPEAVEKTISDGVWHRINLLEESKRLELFKALDEGTITQHPTFVQIMQQIRQKLHQIQPK